MMTLRLWLFLLWTQALASTAWSDDPNNATEYQIKAAYLYKFASYVEWPPATFSDPKTPLTIGVLGADEVALALTELGAGQPSGQREFRIKRLTRESPLTDIQILFVGQRESSNLESLTKAVCIQPVLVVTESRNALATGSIINFNIAEERVRFDVSLLHAKRCGVKISARLLAVAQNIEDGR